MLLFASLLGSLLSAQQPPSQPYVWKNVQIVGGGFVSGIVLHPGAPGVRYARTDIGGAYRWDADARRWQPLMDWVPYEDTNLMGVESIAVDPSDPDRLYLAVGTYTRADRPDGAVLRSQDRGATFLRTNVPFKMGGNENGRGNGERLAVDPNDGRILYLGTRHAGLWKSVDHGANWSRVDWFPDVTETPAVGSGIVFVVFDPQSGAPGRASATIYVGASLMGRDNLFRSTDGGASWTPVPGQPTQYRPNHGVLDSNGVLYVSYGTDPGPRQMTDGGIWKLDTNRDVWTEITPDRPNPAGERAFGYAAVSSDASNPQTLIVSTFRRPRGDEIFRSTDGGATWKPVFASGGLYDFSLAPYVAATPIHWLFDIEIDPHDPDHALFTTGYGGYETFNLTDMDEGRPTRWSVLSTGIEETVALELLSPPAGAQLITAIGDYAGFVHQDLDRPPPTGDFGHPRFGNTSGVALAAQRPNVIVRVGVPANDRGTTTIGYSLDGGTTWQPTRTTPRGDSRAGQIAVSADGAAWIWTPEQSQAYQTRDQGATWAPIAGLPENSRVSSDPVDAQRFYAMDLFGGKIFISDDAGVTFAAQPLRLPGGLPVRGRRGDRRGGQDRLYATPGRRGDLWLAAFDGLYRSWNGSPAFARQDDVQQIHGFGFGKAAPGTDYPALFMIGVVNGLRGIFRSDDTARSWVRINDDAHQWGLLLHVTGDPKRYGRVYVGTHGRGVLYGDPGN
jgi:photosystem II stability/assembly factor-like uncharacterized protein